MPNFGFEGLKETGASIFEKTTKSLFVERVLMFKALSSLNLTPWNTIRLEKVTVVQLIKRFIAFYGTTMFITVFTTPLLNLAKTIHTHTHTTFVYGPLLCIHPIKSKSFTVLRDISLNPLLLYEHDTVPSCRPVF
jgi:hypothetical protein